jgi:glutamyl-tRNA reductase
VVDLGLPRNVSVDVNAIDAVYLYDLDDLDGIAAQGREQRRGAVAPAQEIVREEVDRYERWLSALDAVPVIKELRARAEGLARAEVAKQLRGDFSGPEAEKTERALEALAHALTGKLLHSPLERLRREAEEGRGDYFADAVRALFALDEEEE